MQGLESLSKSLGSLYNYANAINQEVTLQKTLLENMEIEIDEAEQGQLEP
jgi:hypothetical protein